MDVTLTRVARTMRAGEASSEVGLLPGPFVAPGGEHDCPQSANEQDLVPASFLTAVSGLLEGLDARLKIGRPTGDLKAPSQTHTQMTNGQLPFGRVPVEHASATAPRAWTASSRSANRPVCSWRTPMPRPNASRYSSPMGESRQHSADCRLQGPIGRLSGHPVVRSCCSGRSAQRQRSFTSRSPKSAAAPVDPLLAGSWQIVLWLKSFRCPVRS